MKNYLIIGGSSGIGRQLVNLLGSKGYQVYATYYSNQPKSTAQNVHYIPYNVMQDDFPLDLIPEKIDGLVYCPGTIELKPFRRLKTEEVLQDIELQVNGAIKVIQNTYKALRAGQASIVFFSTIAVQQGFSYHAQVAVSKGAVEGLTRSLAAEFAPQMRVNAIAPSITKTTLSEKFLNTEDKIKRTAENHPLKKIGEVNDVAAVAAFLLSDESNWITGQILHVDGGKSSINS